MKPNDNFRWTHKSKDAIIFLEGNDKFVPKAIELDPNLPKKERIDLIGNRLRGYNWKQWFEDSVSVGIKATDPELIKHLMHHADAGVEIEGMTEDQFNQLKEDERNYISYGHILEAITYNAFCMDSSGNDYEMDDEAAEWFQAQIKRLKSHASTNIQIARLIWHNQIKQILEEV